MIQEPKLPNKRYPDPIELHGYGKVEEYNDFLQFSNHKQIEHILITSNPYHQVIIDVKTRFLNCLTVSKLKRILEILLEKD